jgi:hypothetical protein
MSLSWIDHLPYLLRMLQVTTSIEVSIPKVPGPYTITDFFHNQSTNGAVQLLEPHIQISSTVSLLVKLLLRGRKQYLGRFVP